MKKIVVVIVAVVMYGIFCGQGCATMGGSGYTIRLTKEFFGVQNLGGSISKIKKTEKGVSYTTTGKMNDSLYMYATVIQYDEGLKLKVSIGNKGYHPIKINAYSDEHRLISKSGKEYSMKFDIMSYSTAEINPDSSFTATSKMFYTKLRIDDISSVISKLGLEGAMIECKKIKMPVKKKTKNK